MKNIQKYHAHFLYRFNQKSPESKIFDDDRNFYYKQFRRLHVFHAINLKIIISTSCQYLQYMTDNIPEGIAESDLYKA